MHADALRGDKLGLVAGGGEIPVLLAERCVAQGRPLFVLRLRGFADAALARFPGSEVGLAELGRAIDLLKREGCAAVCLIGIVRRPDFAALRPDLRGLRALPGAVAAAARGDDALLRYLLAEFEKEGFRIEGADGAGAAVLGPGPLGAHAPGPAERADIGIGVRAAEALGSLDVGQGAVVRGGLVLALEAQEGTDAMLGRCLELPEGLRAPAGGRSGVLVKWPKPGQDRRIDLPTLGPETLRRAAAAGLAGVAARAGATLLADPEALRREADRLGLFVLGLESGG